MKPTREGEPLLAVGPRWDVGPRVLGGDSFADGVAVVSLVNRAGLRPEAWLPAWPRIPDCRGPGHRSDLGRQHDRQRQRGHGSCS